MESKKKMGEAWTEERHNLYISWLEHNFVEKLYRRLQPETGSGGSDDINETCEGESECSSYHKLDRFWPDNALRSTHSTKVMDEGFEVAESSEASS
ncbi:hypothetical protein IEQ34_019301 [Dendrobium chrysotoxum]|uniref:Uncharacterized protein n=1 Tax=Dendrobium chrysotoxum TaxID=161865 RepID=A0AAV7G8F4_DENCH|nr:hypothetical protein IEQ34_019301 [Dendrobium chrysotoxum]